MGIYGNRMRRDHLRWLGGTKRRKKPQRDRLVPLRKKRRRLAVDRRDHGTGNRGSRRDHGKWASRKLPCGGVVRVFRGVRKPKVNPDRKVHFITDKRHFAGMKAHDTKLWNQARSYIGHIQRSIMLKRWESASKWNLRMALWVNKLFGREEELP